jgi:excisionase family DNA binding protein
MTSESEVEELTVKEFAARERVTERTVRLWMTKGAIQFRRTPGGGIRIRERRAVTRSVAEICGSSSR